jgi:lipid A 3-O-deacylase
MKKIFILLLIISSFYSQSIFAGSFSIFGGIYDYDDDNTTNLSGFNLHSSSEIDVFGILDISPVVGAFVTAKSASMVYGGFDTKIGTEKIYLNPSFSTGFYNNGSGKDLGNSLQFKSEVNIFYSINDGSRVGFGSHHISNAGLSSVNPGVNNYYLIFNQDF